MILTHGSNSVGSGGGGNVIGGREYKVVTMPDGHVWLAENLDYKFQGCGIGGAFNVTTPNAWYYGNDEASYGIDGTYKCGLLYNWYAVDYLNTNRETLCPGWHVPSSTEWANLINITGGTSSGKLKAVRESWFSSSWNGTDDYGLRVIPAGQASENQFQGIGSNGPIWTSTPSGSSAYRELFEPSTIGLNYSISKIRGHSVRLIKDY